MRIVLNIHLEAETTCAGIGKQLGTDYTEGAPEN